MEAPLDLTVKQLGDGEFMWRGSGEVIFKLSSYQRNPVVKPQEIGLTWKEKGLAKIGAVFNGGAEIFQDKVILMPRCHQRYKKGTFFDERMGRERSCMENYISEIWPLVSTDGLHFSRLGNTVIRGDGTDHKDFLYGIEDIRIIRSKQRYLLIGCGKIKPPFKGGNADRIAIYSTEDFLKITYRGMVGAFDSRNAVPFSGPIGGRYYMLFRFHPHIHLDLLRGGLDQLLNPSQYPTEWEEIYRRRRENLLLGAGHLPHEGEKVGPGPQIIKTNKGWLLIYHAVGEIGEEICRIYGLEGKIERGYSICAALLDLHDPGKVLCRSKRPIYIPSAPYELRGNDQYPVDVPAVVFPMGAIVWQGKLLLYCGAGDKYIILLSCSLANLIEYLWEDCRL